MTQGDGISRRAVLGAAGGLLFVPWWIRWRAAGRALPSLRTLTTRPLAGFGTIAVSVRDAAGSERSACVLLADTVDRRERGLMEVTRADIRGFGGMLFVFESERQLSFWMRNTPMPLSIAFFDGAGRFVSSADMEPCGDSRDCPTTPSQGLAQYALEMPRGMLPSLGIGPGSVLTLAGRCSSLRS
ncbi:MAG: DUF192 domain-containing protein [Actinomycetota bacterium]